MNNIIKTLLILIILVVIGYFTQDYWMPTSTPSQEYIEELSYINNGCVTVTSPAIGTVVSFPLVVTATIDYGCRIIFEAQAGTITLSQNNQVVSSVSPFFVIGDYYDEVSYPVTAQATINSDTAVAGPAELIITPENPCGDAPECPPVPALITVPVVVP